MNEKTKAPNDPFVERLVQQIDRSKDRGRAAELRRFWSPTTRHYAYPVLARLGVTHPGQPDAFTAALFAVHPQNVPGGNTVGKAALALGERKEDHHPYDSHFRRLLASDSIEDAAQQLHRLVKRLSRSQPPIALDYNRILWDLRNWSKKADDVKARWAMDFWQTPSELSNPLSV